MKIQSINPINIYNVRKNNKEVPEKEHFKEYAYNPIAYNDLTFGARLFRSPENFYAQPFNKHGMPDTMKEYLNADYSDRQKMPPAQMLKLVFDDINETKNLEQVRRIFPDEPLFKNLTDSPNRKARTGILAEIDIMREENKSLFKSGKDNLGHYILKKIYTESKTLKEINEDFKRDVSVYYSGLSPIEYSTLAAFGIKFPNNAFWKSLTATREEFPYEYKPRKPIESRNGSGKTSSEKPVTVKPRKRFENVKDWEIDSLSDAMVKGNGSKTETVKRLKKSSVRDEASLGFVARYMGEINSVVLEKLHISPEMSEFFENYDGLSKSQKQRLDDYWKNTDTKELRSTIMKDVIRLFFDAYGVDGQNDEFKELLDYAHSIKPNRIAELKEHNRIQSEYDEMFAELDAEEKAHQAVESEQPIEPTQEEIIQDVIKKSDVDTYRFKDGDDDIVIVTNLKQDFKDYLNDDMCLYPALYAKKYTNFILNNPLLTENYMLSELVKLKGIELPEDERIISEEELKDIKKQLIREFNNNNRAAGRAAQQAVIDVLDNLLYVKNVADVYNLNPAELTLLFNKIPSQIKDLLKSERGLIDKKYNEYMKPVSQGEARKISNAIINIWRNYNPNDTLFVEEYANPLFYAISKYLNNKNYNKQTFRENLEKYIMEYGGSSRFFLKKDASKELLKGKFEEFIMAFSSERGAILAAYAPLDTEGMEYIRIHNYDLYKIIAGIIGL